MKANLNLRTLVAAAVVASSAMVGTAYAASGTNTAAVGPRTVAAPVNFAITIPAFLYFQVGNVGSTNTMTFAVPAANVGNATAVAPTGGTAPAAGGPGVNVVVRGNNGQVVISTAVASALGLGTGTATDGYINYNQITTTSSDAANLPAPVLANAAIPNVNAALGGGAAGAGKVTNRAATWTYSYLNATTPSAGSYTGVATYTATMP
ncbi:MAG: hypothetical protein IPP91_15050 [Betaproteobacteria bacterium]|nr:hypothetical protein [Betaproteobacteria bacterium]